MSGVTRMVYSQGTEQKLGLVYELHWPYISTWGEEEDWGQLA